MHRQISNPEGHLRSQNWQLIFIFQQKMLWCCCCGFFFCLSDHSCNCRERERNFDFDLSLKYWLFCVMWSPLLQKNNGSMWHLKGYSWIALFWLISSWLPLSYHSEVYIFLFKNRGESRRFVFLEMYIYLNATPLTYETSLMILVIIKRQLLTEI